MKVAVIFGSKTDANIMSGSINVLKEFEIQNSIHILSAHRVPEKLDETIIRLEKEEYDCIIAGAGLAAHLPGVIASKTIIPVIGVPINASLDGIDALLSIVQMPKDIPVATVGINNSYNAGILAVEILSLKYGVLKEKLNIYRKDMKEKFFKENRGELYL